MSKPKKQNTVDLISQECNKLRGQNKVLREMCMSFNSNMQNEEDPMKDADQSQMNEESLDVRRMLETLKEENENLKQSLGL